MNEQAKRDFALDVFQASWTQYIQNIIILFPIFLDFPIFANGQSSTYSPTLVALVNAQILLLYPLPLSFQISNT